MFYHSKKKFTIDFKINMFIDTYIYIQKICFRSVKLIFGIFLYLLLKHHMKNSETICIASNYIETNKLLHLKLFLL